MEYSDVRENGGLMLCLGYFAHEPKSIKNITLKRYLSKI